MNCPYCLKEMKKGGVKVIDTSNNMYSSVLWYPEEELNRKIKINWVELDFKAEGYYCDECMKVVSIFEEK